LQSECALASASSLATAAYEDCFGGGVALSPIRTEPVAERVSMSELRSGDRVLSVEMPGGGLLVDRVFFNAHKRSRVTAPLICLHFLDGGSLCVSERHLLPDNKGDLFEARSVTSGFSLPQHDGRTMRVEYITYSHGSVVNPVTVHGYILAAGSDNKPVVASTIVGPGQYLLKATGRVIPPVLATVAAYFPEAMQKADELISHRSSVQLVGRIEGVLANSRLPSPVAAVGFTMLDIGLVFTVLLSLMVPPQPVLPDFLARWFTWATCF